ncbi:MULTISPECIES: diguanylate cyclase [Bosea]|uniref:diguanylate cyclase n=1 Tax=Bosea vaviloviae TaxID=1526658 RepID=A0A0N1F101_9HYPH|nr:diguanylate cyclase [Bosea vaviloviae]KPH77798.1 diguanylate cyclase [Bosea vaviloviae]
MAVQTALSTRKSRLPLMVGVFVALACCTISAVSIWRELSARTADLRSAEVDVANMARSLMQHAEDSIELSEAILLGLVARIENAGTSEPAVQLMQAFLEARGATLGRIRGLFVYDYNGNWLATTEKVQTRSLNNSDRTYFQHHRANDDRKTYVGDPVRSRSGGQWIITVSRRFNKPDGSFGGVVLATLDAAYFTRFYNQYDLGPNGSVALLNTRGVLLARSRDDGQLVGRDMSDTALFRQRLNEARSALYYFVSPIDGLQRISAYRASERYPLVLLATEAEMDVLARWRSGVAIRTGVTLSLVFALAIVGFYLVRQFAARQRMAAAMAAQEADFRLLAETSSDMVTRIGLDELLRYVSPSAGRIVGWDASQLEGTPALAGVHAEDIARVRALVSDLRTGAQIEGRVAYRTRHRERGEVWLESCLRVTRDSATGSVDSVVAVSRDMTEHKDLQDRLADLAATDALTRLANRRTFDERFSAEWENAGASKSCLSIVMVDVDHFKSYNDSYGHDTGDSCLQSVARALKSVVHRPHDLVARYGGEEFVVLLPNTDPAGCAAVAQQLHDAIAALRVPHIGNPSIGRVSISLGGATAIPGQGATMAAMVKAADAALYVAKRAGRNQFYMAPRLGLAA